MDKNIETPKAGALSSLSALASGSWVSKGLALCEGILLGLLAYTLNPESRLMIVAVSVFTIIFVFMLMFWLVRFLKSVDDSRIQSQPVKQDVNA